MIPFGTDFSVCAYVRKLLKQQVHPKAIFLLVGCLPLFLYGQDECLDPLGDCTLANPITFDIELDVSCGDTVLLEATNELCNDWIIPNGLSYEFGTGSDSSSIWLYIDQCLEEEIIVDGITNTPSGGGFASCDTRFVYTFAFPIDTITQGLACEEYFALPSPTALLQSSCGCDSVYVEYFNLGGVDTTFLALSSCDPAQEGINTQELIASTGCDSVVITTTTLDPLPAVETNSQIVCEGEVITLFAFSEDAVSYLWSTGATEEFIETTEEGTYSVTITDSNGCTATGSATADYGDIEITLNVSVNEPFLLSVDPLKVWQGAAIELDVDVEGTAFPYEILWNRGPELGDTVLNYIAQESGEVTVAIIDSIGCIGLDTLPVEVRPLAVYIPTAFSPNDDEHNDWFHVYTTPNIEEARLQIFSRTGALVYEELRLEAIPEGDGLLWQGWNGTFNGTLLPPQVFVYQFLFRPLRGEWQQLSGDINLIR